jgi:polyphosphate kinase
MDRNLSRRVEVVFPIEQPDLKARVIDEILAISLADNQRARLLLPDGTYTRVQPQAGELPVRSQQRFMELALESEKRGLPGSTEQKSNTPSTTPKVVKRTRTRKQS